MSDYNESCSICKLLKIMLESKADVLFEDDEVIIGEQAVLPTHLDKHIITSMSFDGKEVEIPDINKDYKGKEFFEKYGRSFSMDGILILQKEHTQELNKVKIRKLLRELKITGIIDWDLNPVPEHTSVTMITNPLPRSKDWEYLV